MHLDFEGKKTLKTSGGKPINDRNSMKRVSEKSDGRKTKSLISSSDLTRFTDGMILDSYDFGMKLFVRYTDTFKISISMK